MKVSVAFGTRAHAYSLAKCLHNNGYLSRLYTYYPSPFIDKALRPYARSFPWVHGLAMILSRTGMGRMAKYLYWPANEVFDRWVAAVMEPCDVFMAMSGLGLYARRAARKLGALTVCDRGSTHILYQDQILAVEFERLGMPYQPIDPRTVFKEMQEYAEADLIVVQSSFAYRTFLEKGVPPSKLAFIPLGVDLQLFHPIPKTDDVFRVLFAGQICLRKGIPDLLEALATLELRRFELMLIGQLLPEVSSFLSRYEGGFRYVGRLATRAQLFQYYSQASVCVFPSIEDGFGQVLHEAMACGVPIITTPNTGGPDLITDGVEGFIVPIRSPEAIREKVLYLYEHPDKRDEMARAALNRAQLGGWDKYGERVLDLYKQVLSRRSDHNQISNSGN